MIYKTYTRVHHVTMWRIRNMRGKQFIPVIS